MILEASNTPYRRFFEKMNDSGRFAVDNSFGGVFSGKNRSNNVEFLFRVVVGFFAEFIHEDFDFEEHEFFEAMHDSRELVFAGHRICSDLSG